MNYPCHAPSRPTAPRWNNDSLFQPETPRQAKRHQQYAVHYTSAGLCAYCASQAAFGHVHGFTVVEPVRDCCRAVIANFPRAEHCCWRSLPLGSRRRSEDRPATAEVVPASISHAVSDAPSVASYNLLVAV